MSRDGLISNVKKSAAGALVGLAALVSGSGVTCPSSPRLSYPEFNSNLLEGKTADVYLGDLDKEVNNKIELDILYGPSLGTLDAVAVLPSIGPSGGSIGDLLEGVGIPNDYKAPIRAELIPSEEASDIPFIYADKDIKLYRNTFSEGQGNFTNGETHTIAVYSTNTGFGPVVDFINVRVHEGNSPEYLTGVIDGFINNPPVGEQGPQGDQGPQGPPGMNGNDGANGSDGNDGANCFDGITTDMNGDGVIDVKDCVVTPQDLYNTSWASIYDASMEDTAGKGHLNNGPLYAAPTPGVQLKSRLYLNENLNNFIGGFNPDAPGAVEVRELGYDGIDNCFRVENVGATVYVGKITHANGNVYDVFETPWDSIRENCPPGGQLNEAWQVKYTLPGSSVPGGFEPITDTENVVEAP